MYLNAKENQKRERVEDFLGIANLEAEILPCLYVPFFFYILLFSLNFLLSYKF